MFQPNDLFQRTRRVCRDSAGDRHAAASGAGGPRGWARCVVRHTHAQPHAHSTTTHTSAAAAAATEQLASAPAVLAVAIGEPRNEPTHTDSRPGGRCGAAGRRGDAGRARPRSRGEAALEEEEVEDITLPAEDHVRLGAALRARRHTRTCYRQDSRGRQATLVRDGRPLTRGARRLDRRRELAECRRGVARLATLIGRLSSAPNAVRPQPPGRSRAPPAAVELGDVRSRRSFACTSGHAVAGGIPTLSGPRSCTAEQEFFAFRDAEVHI